MDILHYMIIYSLYTIYLYIFHFVYYIHFIDVYVYGLYVYV